MDIETLTSYIKRNSPPPCTWDLTEDNVDSFIGGVNNIFTDYIKKEGKVFEIYSPIADRRSKKVNSETPYKFSNIEIGRELRRGFFGRIIKGKPNAVYFVYSDNSFLEGIPHEWRTTIKLRGTKFSFIGDTGLYLTHDFGMYKGLYRILNDEEVRDLIQREKFHKEIPF